MHLISFDGAWFLLAIIVEGDESNRLRMANWPAVLAGYRPLLTALGTSHDVKGFAIGSFLERIVVERANDNLCQKNVKNTGLISAKPINFKRNLP